jgi:hypothetical protein
MPRIFVPQWVIAILLKAPQEFLGRASGTPRHCRDRKSVFLIRRILKSLICILQSLIAIMPKAARSTAQFMERASGTPRHCRDRKSVFLIRRILKSLICILQSLIAIMPKAARSTAQFMERASGTPRHCRDRKSAFFNPINSEIVNLHSAIVNCYYAKFCKECSTIYGACQRHSPTLP